MLLVQHKLQGWTDKFSKQLAVPEGEQASEGQLDLYRSEREYLVPVMNRGQAVRFHYLNAAKSQNGPTIWLDILHKGVRTKFRRAPIEVFGVPQPTAALVGLLLGLILLTIVIATVHRVWLAAIITFLYGLIAQLPGVAAIRIWRWIRESLGG